MPIIKNSGSLYLPDGDIVLFSLPKDDVITAFKVDRVLLRRASPVFEAMFALPPSENNESYDDTPLVKLQDESDHLTMFLNALYDSRCIPWQKNGLRTVREVDGTLILAVKYQVDHLHQRIVSLLERDWPSILADWDINEAELNIRGWPAVLTLTPEPCEVISLARKCGITSILPAAFYHSARIQASSDRRLLSPEEMKNCRSADFSLLSAEDFRRLVIGRNKIMHIFRRYLTEAHSYALDTHKLFDSSRDKCRSDLDGFKDRVELRVFRYINDPLTMMRKEVCMRDESPIQSCYSCKDRFIRSLESRRNAFWEELPSLFLLDSEQ
ncbi:hypothetical protein Clacol_007876 [Clathrus columnatus]|uniref:BTB domain-containing protein n=1 Tax=Clathrus columnatus TaxID=1419009 RepID=A0AAV5AGZ0_9AGAM|nr:hypothetical protein Clacol_007876 [Clathrus columnatus]